MFRSLSHLSGKEVIEAAKRIRVSECSSAAEMVMHLSEIAVQGYYREEGYPSLFMFCVKALNYCEPTAYRYKEAALAIQLNPKMYELIESGKMTLSAFNAVKSVLTEENKEQVLTLIQGKTKKEAEVLAVSMGAPVPKKRETVRAKKVIIEDSKDELSPVKVEMQREVSFRVSEQVFALYEEVQALIGYVDMAQVFERSLTECKKVLAPSLSGSFALERAIQGSIAVIFLLQYGMRCGSGMAVSAPLSVRMVFGAASGVRFSSIISCHAVWEDGRSLLTYGFAARRIISFTPRSASGGISFRRAGNEEWSNFHW